MLAEAARPAAVKRAMIGVSCSPEHDMLGDCVLLDWLQMLVGLMAVSDAALRGILAGTSVDMIAPTGRDAHGGESGERGAAPVRAIQRRPGPWAPPDRKSTRLNSSHLGISYAVFC